MFFNKKIWKDSDNFRHTKIDFESQKIANCWGPEVVWSSSYQKIFSPSLLIYIYLDCVRRSSWSATTLDTLKIGSPISAQPKRKIPYQRSQSTPSGGPSSSKNSLNQSSNAIEKMNKMSGTSEEQEKLKSAQKSKQSSESNGNTSSKGY